MIVADASVVFEALRTPGPAAERIALTERLDVPFLTGDIRLARTPGLKVAVEVLPVS